MGSLLRCLLRNCLENENEGEENYHPPRLPPPRSVLRRTSSARRSVGSGSSRRVYSAPGGGESENVLVSAEGEGVDGDDCCHGDAATALGEGEEGETTPDVGASLRALISRLNLGMSNSPFDSRGQDGESPPVEQAPPPPGGSFPMPPLPGIDRFGVLRRTSSMSKNVSGHPIKTAVPLRAAASFDSSLEIPAICLDEVVVPGSELQLQMAEAMKQNLEDQGDECVICMDGFDPTNPRMPTLCGCGENKTYFHLPCLYQWTEQNRNCPSCRKRLRWEEF